MVVVRSEILEAYLPSTQEVKYVSFFLDHDISRSWYKLLKILKSCETFYFKNITCKLLNFRARPRILDSLLFFEIIIMQRARPAIKLWKRNTRGFKVIMQGKLFQRCTHLLYCSVLSLGGNVNTRRMLKPDMGMGSIFHIKNTNEIFWSYETILWIIKIIKFNAFTLLGY